MVAPLLTEPSFSRTEPSTLGRCAVRCADLLTRSFPPALLPPPMPGPFPFVIVMRGDRERTLEAGCDGYIQKPIDVDELPNQIKRFLVVR